jgi:hypothetical protein
VTDSLVTSLASHVRTRVVFWKSKDRPVHDDLTFLHSFLSKFLKKSFFKIGPPG